MLLVAGAVAGGIAVIAKWLVVGRIRAVEHPLWSSFVWRNEVSDTFVETVAAPWFARAASGTPVMNLWLRALGAKIGRGVWCETYWLPEADLVTLGDGATVNRGCVVQTHLFHDRIMRMDTVVLERGRHARPALRGAARRAARRRRHRRAGVAGDARRRGAAVDALAGQPDRAVAAFAQEARRHAGRRRKKHAPRDSSQAGGQEGVAPVIDPYLPATGNFGYRVSRYELDLEYKVAINRLAGAATITAVTLAALRTFTLDLSDALSVTKVTVNGTPARTISSTSAASCTSPCATALPAGAAMTIAVRYGGTPRPIRSLWGDVGFEELTEGVLVAGQPNGAASWFPCDDHPSAKASFRIQISTESPYLALANGELVSRRARAGMTTWTYEQPEPTSTYLITLQIGMYERHRLAKNGVEIHAVAARTGCAENFEHDFGRQPQMMKLFVKLFGPYPLDDRLHRGGDRRRSRDSP